MKYFLIWTAVTALNAWQLVYRQGLHWSGYIVLGTYGLAMYALGRWTVLDIARKVIMAAQSDMKVLRDSFFEAKNKVAASRRVLTMLELLAEDEGNAVTLVCPNPDFNGQPDRNIEVTAKWTGWKPKRYGGPTLLEACESAVAEMKLAKNDPT